MRRRQSEAAGVSQIVLFDVYHSAVSSDCSIHAEKLDSNLVIFSTPGRLGCDL